MKIRPTVRQLSERSFEVEHEPLKGDFLDCALGKNSFGTSEKVLEFAREYNWSGLQDAPDTSYRDLKQAICRFWCDWADLKPDNIKIANGSMVVLSRLNKVFLDPGTKVLGYVPQFSEYMCEVMRLGGIYEAVLLNPKERYRFNLEKLLSKLSQDYAIVYVDNPINPTGHFISLDDVEVLIKEAEKHDVLAILDEAYGDYIEEEHSAVNLIHKYKNLVITRTFTKGYGIGKIRVGYAVIPAEIGRYYDKIDLPFSVSEMGAALCVVALQDHDFIIRLRQMVTFEKAKIVKGLAERGYLISETHESVPIFIAGHQDEGFDLRDHMLNKGIYALSGTSFENLGINYVRINTPANSEDFLDRLSQ